MEVPDIRVGITHDLAVQLQPHAKDAVRARMLRAHVELDPIGRRLVLRAERLLRRARAERLLRRAGTERLLHHARVSHGSRRAPALQASRH